MQFYQVVIRSEIGAEDVLNTLWYRRNTVGLPTLLDQTNLANYVSTTIIPKFAALQTTSTTYRETTVFSYRDTWERTPFLSYSKTETLAGALAALGAPPMYVAIIAFRVEPTVNDPTSGKPVRRGYLALSGTPEDYYTAVGTYNGPDINAPGFLALTDQLKASFLIAGAAEVMEPIRVSKPGPLTDARGYGLIKDVLVRAAASARRTRKRGIGG